MIRLAVVFGMTCCAAQASELRGTVAASTRAAPIAGARVSLRIAGREFRTATDAQGEFRFAGAAISGKGSLEVAADGIQPFTLDAVDPDTQTRAIDIRLELSDVQESIVVEGGVVSLGSNSPDVSQTIGNAQLKELPSNTRSLMKFALLDPDVRQGVGLGGDGNNGNRLSINAGSYWNTSYLLDGVINYDWIYANGPYQSVPLSAADEMQVITNQYAAQYGTSTTSLLKVTTRSGGNDLHGEAFAFVRPSGIQAAPPLSPFNVPNEREQWVALMGGPIGKDKTFCFLDYEGIDQNRGSYIQSPAPSFFTGETKEYYALGRVDNLFTADRVLSLRLNGYHYENSNANDRVGGFNQPAYGRFERTQSWGGQLSDQMVIGRAVNELRVNFTSCFRIARFRSSRPWRSTGLRIAYQDCRQAHGTMRWRPT